MLAKLLQKVKALYGFALNGTELNTHKPLYKLVEIREEDKEYTVVIKVANKNITFDAKPEEILANDYLVDQFSPRDIRALTYLGYLGINGPKYQILAKKLSLNEKITFILKKKGDKKVIARTADQIINEADIIPNLNSEDAKTIGYTVALEIAANEKMQKEAILNERLIEEK
jgi:hypothetical protein